MLFVWFVLVISMFIGFWVFRRQDGKLRVLMYHKVLPDESNMLTVTTAQLDTQLQYLRQQGYEFISIRNLLNLSSPPSNAVLLTFDDAYLNNLEHAYPLLKKHRACATIFVPSGYVGQNSGWDPKPDPLMSVQQLRDLDHEVFDLGLHTHLHRNFADLSKDKIETEISNNIQFFRDNQLEFVPALAYPYGGRPKDKHLKNQMKQLLSQLGVTLAFRIGNRLNDWPVTNRYEIQRIDVRGTDSMADFRRKIRWGKLI
jgi:peptidoglycan/xylan/chitin deacetylase (PgdA/CDA1 family)